MKKGHNNPPEDVEDNTVFGGVSGEQLRAYIERIERLREEKRAIAEDEKEVFAEAKANGFDNTMIREMLKLRAKEASDRDEFETIRALYMRALEMGLDLA